MAFPKPSRNSVKALHHFTKTDLGGMIPAVQLIWGEEFDTSAEDLVSLRESRNVDAFSNFVVDDFIPWFHEHVFAKLSKRIREDNPWTSYNHELWLRYTSSSITVVACLLPVLFISVLCSVHTTKWRLLAIGCFNILSSVCLDLFTTARRVEIFAVTAA